MRPPKGYTAEELERDNPYNQWMFEGEDEVKQAVDKFTGDMFEQAHEAQANDKPMYEVTIVTTDGIVLTWTHMTRAQALALHKMNDTKLNVLRSSTEVRQFGWKEMV